MGLLKLLILAITFHLGLAITQASVSYFAGDVADPGAEGFISYTPVGALLGDTIDDDAKRERSLGGGLNWADPRSALDIVQRVGGTINGLALAEYDLLEEIERDSFAYNVVILVRLFSVLLTLALGFTLLRDLV